MKAILSKPHSLYYCTVSKCPFYIEHRENKDHMLVLCKIFNKEDFKKNCLIMKEKYGYTIMRDYSLI